MIPKKIHYVWLGKNPHPNLMDICINSWREKLPGYEIIEWNEETLNFYEEMEKNRFLKECYKRKLWAFLSDYFRIKILYEEGGIYLDTDMQIVKNIDSLLFNEFFIGVESKEIISAGIIGIVPKHELMKKILEFYENDIWNEPIFTIPDIITRVINKEYHFQMKEDITYIADGMVIYPARYFYPYHFTEKFEISCIKNDTYGIHWWGKSWGEKKNLSKLYFLEFKHYHGHRKILIELLIITGLMKFVKRSKLLKNLGKRL
ncbi:Mannosyltransferase OCH1 and related enzymes [Fusobacterium necrogenes]|uniref:Mannosyltransferase OCH1 and related enzymes n=1 Tax=Fusobacterium necrogenes TaxID=858 RepID=A0A377GWR1_9FUSO|nr:glycosyltransferase [Fusobacterium necrogenes]STO31283.1 Mannosyltransferase OCH1 and related enzymes [Fusobacterium necrogenes]